MRDLPVRKIPGFGRVTERCLEGLGVEVRGQAYRPLILDLRRCLDKENRFDRHEPLVRFSRIVVSLVVGPKLRISKAYLGIADNNVAPGKRGERKSVGVERQVYDTTF